MEISFDDAKRALTLAERGLDFADALRVFEGLSFTQEDTRFAYPERRSQTYGLLDDRVVMRGGSEKLHSGISGLSA